MLQVGELPVWSEDFCRSVEESRFCRQQSSTKSSSQTFVFTQKICLLMHLDRYHRWFSMVKICLIGQFKSMSSTAMALGLLELICTMIQGDLTRRCNLLLEFTIFLIWVWKSNSRLIPYQKNTQSRKKIPEYLVVFPHLMKWEVI